MPKSHQGKEDKQLFQNEINPIHKDHFQSSIDLHSPLILDVDSSHHNDQDSDDFLFGSTSMTASDVLLIQDDNDEYDDPTLAGFDALTIRDNSNAASNTILPVVMGVAGNNIAMDEDPFAVLEAAIENDTPKYDVIGFIIALLFIPASPLL